MKERNIDKMEVTMNIQDAFFDELSKIAGIGQITQAEAPAVEANTLKQLAAKGITPEMHAQTLATRMKELPLGEQQAWMGRMQTLYPDSALRVRNAMNKVAIVSPETYRFGGGPPSFSAGGKNLFSRIGSAVSGIGKPKEKATTAGVVGGVLSDAGRMLDTAGRTT